jgi:endo-1,4-beta-mannosidase
VCIQSWLELASSYVKSIDSNHLVYTGLSGLFGISTPQLWVYWWLSSLAFS